MTSDRSSNGSQPHPRNQTWRKRLCRYLGCEPENKEQLVELLQDAERRALLDREALAMIEGVLQVSDLRVGDIMIRAPRWWPSAATTR